MKGSKLVFLVLFLVTGCTTTLEWFSSKKDGKKETYPPQQYSENLHSKYLEAKKLYNEDKKLQACQGLLNILKQSELFYLRAFFQIKSLEFCTFKKENITKKIEEIKSITPPWLMEFFLKKSISLLIKHHFNNEAVSSTREYTKYKYNQKDKMKLINEALKIIPGDKKTLALLYKISPRLNSKITIKNAYPMGRDFEKNRQFKKARAIYEKILKAKNISFKTKIKALTRIKWSYKNQRNYTQYIEEINKAGIYLKKNWNHPQFSIQIQKAWWENEIGHARAIWTQHKRKKAANILLKLIKKKKIPRYSLTYSLFILASMEIEKKNYIEAIKYLKKAQSVKIKNPVLNQKISWSIGWNLFLQNKFKESSSFFNKEKKKHNDYFFNLKLNFWESISLDKLGHKKQAEYLWDEMYKSNPFSYYGIISQLKLNKPFHPLIKKEKKTNTLNKNQSNTLDFLVSIKKLELARNFLVQSSKKIKSIKELKSLVPFYNKLKWHRGLINKFYSIKANKRVPHTKYFFHHLFPMPFQRFVNKASKKFNIERELIYSITRQESAFDLYSRSYAEAYGPMQITPENASFLSKKFKINYKSPHDLFIPQINFYLGSALLKGLQERFNHQFIFYVAAYNANHMSVERWAKERYNGDSLQFIELIPYNETKNYVKLVLRNYINYKRLNSKKPFYFPKDIL